MDDYYSVKDCLFILIGVVLQLAVLTVAVSLITTAVVLTLRFWS